MDLTLLEEYFKVDGCKSIRDAKESDTELFSEQYATQPAQHNNMQYQGSFGAPKPSLAALLISSSSSCTGDSLGQRTAFQALPTWSTVPQSHGEWSALSTQTSVPIRTRVTEPTFRPSRSTKVLKNKTIHTIPICQMHTYLSVDISSSLTALLRNYLLQLSTSREVDFQTLFDDGDWQRSSNGVASSIDHDCVDGQAGSKEADLRSNFWRIIYSRFKSWWNPYHRIQLSSCAGALDVGSLAKWQTIHDPASHFLSAGSSCSKFLRFRKSKLIDKNVSFK